MAPAAMAHTQGHLLMRWRACDPAESKRYARGVADWTRVHVTTTSGTLTLCGLQVPEWSYMEDIGTYVPDDAPRCQRCMASVKRNRVKVDVGAVEPSQKDVV
jgi:hypothetical protein